MGVLGSDAEKIQCGHVRKNGGKMHFSRHGRKYRCLGLREKKLQCEPYQGIKTLHIFSMQSVNLNTHLPENHQMPKPFPR